MGPDRLMPTKAPGTYEFEQAALCWDKAASCRHAARCVYNPENGQVETYRQADVWVLGAEAWERAGKAAVEKQETD